MPTGCPTVGDMEGRWSLTDPLEDFPMTTAQTTAATPTLTVYYRTGGPERCIWREVFERYSTTGEAQAKCAELGRAGYKALYQDSALLERIGLPEGWEAGEERPRGQRLADQMLDMLSPEARAGVMKYINA